MTDWIRVAGVGQLILAIGSTAIPVVLGWKRETATLSPLTRAVFWTYAGYILGAHLMFGTVSALAPRILVDGSPLAACVCGFIALWWGARLCLQFAAIGVHRPPAAFFVVAELGLVAMFIFFFATYVLAGLANVRGDAGGAETLRAALHALSALPLWSAPQAGAGGALLAGAVLFAAAAFLVPASDGRAHPARRALAWSLVVAAPIAGVVISRGEEPWFRMIAVIVLLLFAMKVVVLEAASVPLPAVRRLAFVTVWPGMRPQLFAAAGAPSGEWPTGRLLFNALEKLLLGLLLLGAARIVALAWGSLAATPLLLAGLSFTLHFGLFDLATVLWRVALGAPAEKLFRNPLASVSLREFWGRRWNLAFSEMTAAALYKPLARAAGPTKALLIAFALSGLFHELAISLPAGAGWGGPTLYFLLHGGALLAEKRLPVLAAKPALGRAWTAAWVLLPLPLLFHRPFLAAVVWPLLG